MQFKSFDWLSHYTMIYKHGMHMRDFLGLFVFIAV